MIWNIDPVLLPLGPLQIRYYGVLFALGLFLAYTVIRRLCHVKKLSLEHFDDLVFYLVIGLVVGARLGHIVFYELDYYLAHPWEILAVWHGGLASHGATIGLLVAFGLFLWRHPKVRFFDYADLIVVGAGLPIACIRLGNFFNSELVGRPTELPWGVIFERVDLVTRHPSQLYESAIGLLLFVTMFALWKKFQASARPGFFVGIFFMLYFASRFLVEFVKDFPLHENALSLTTGQLLSVPFFLLGLGLLLRSQSSAKKSP